MTASFKRGWWRQAVHFAGWREVVHRARWRQAVHPTAIVALVCAGLLAACQGTGSTTGGTTVETIAENAGTPAPVVFPTMTVGAVVSGALLPPAAQGAAGNPATAIARANAPTPMPDTRTCPPPDTAAALPPAPPADSDALAQAAETYLSAGGDPLVWEGQLRAWGLLGGSGRVVRDLDLTNDGVNDVLISAIAPGEGGMLQILVCGDGAFPSRYAAVTGGDAPQVINASDMNMDGVADVVFTSQVCGLDTSGLDDGQAVVQSEDGCEYNVQLATWDAGRGRFDNLLDRDLRAPTQPTLEDYDNDQVAEVIVRAEFNGNAETGPLRTGFTVYDWNGTVYTRSITQLAPPRFRVQMAKQADDALAIGNIGEAIALYELTISDPGLEDWQNDDEDVLRAYGLYRLLLVQAFTEDPGAADTQAAVVAAYPDEANDPVYAEMARRFWEIAQITGDLSAACAAVRDTVALRPDALSLINDRYGAQGFGYDAVDLCPF